MTDVPTRLPRAMRLGAFDAPVIEPPAGGQSARKRFADPAICALPSGRLCR